LLETPDDDGVGGASSRPEHFKIVGEDDEVPGAAVGSRHQSAPEFGKAAGADLGWSQFPEPVAKNRQREDADALEFLRLSEIQRLPQVEPARWMYRVDAAVDSNRRSSKGSIGVGVTGKASGAEGVHLVAPGRGQELATVGQKDALFLQRVVGKMLALPGCSGKEQGPNFVGPFGMQVQLDLLLAGANEFNDNGEVLDAKAPGKQWFDEEDTLQAMIVEDFEGLGQRVFAAR